MKLKFNCMVRFFIKDLRPKIWIHNPEYNKYYNNINQAILLYLKEKYYINECDKCDKNKDIVIELQHNTSSSKYYAYLFNTCCNQYLLNSTEYINKINEDLNNFDYKSINGFIIKF